MTDIRSALEAAREALRLLLATPEIADAHPADKDEETHVAERKARASISQIDAALASLDAPQPDALREAENAVSHAFGLLSSAVRCGEAWRQELDDAKDRARAALARLKGEGEKPAIDTGARRELLARAIEALEALLACPEIADCDPRDKDPETHVAEQKARAALARLKGEG